MQHLGPLLAQMAVTQTFQRSAAAAGAASELPPGLRFPHCAAGVRLSGVAALGLDLASRLCAALPAQLAGPVFVQDLTWVAWGPWADDPLMTAEWRAGQFRLVLVDADDPASRGCGYCVPVEGCVAGDRIAALALVLLDFGATHVRHPGRRDLHPHRYQRFPRRDRPECTATPLERLLARSGSEPTLVAWLDGRWPGDSACGRSAALPSVAMDRHFSDKGPIGHSYTKLYDLVLPPRCSRVRDVLEVGIGSRQPGVPSQMHAMHVPHGEVYEPGASLRGWRDVFPRASVVGIDVDRSALVQGPRIRSYLCNTLNASQVREVLGDQAFDLIVDDGLHTQLAQRATLRALWPHLRGGGYYVVEDVAWTWASSSEVPPGLGPGILVGTGGSAPVFLVVKQDAAGAALPPAGRRPSVPGLMARYNACWSALPPGGQTPERCCGQGGVFPAPMECGMSAQGRIGCCEAHFARARVLA